MQCQHKLMKTNKYMQSVRFWKVSKTPTGGGSLKITGRQKLRSLDPLPKICEPDMTPPRFVEENIEPRLKI